MRQQNAKQHKSAGYTSQISFDSHDSPPVFSLSCLFFSSLLLSAASAILHACRRDIKPHAIVAAAIAATLIIPIAPQPSPGYPDVQLYPTDQLALDPERFQYKEAAKGQAGVSDLFKGVEYDPKRAGRISVWKDPEDGLTYVVNGHHRHEMAVRSGAPSEYVQFIDAADWKEARYIGAIENITDGRGTVCCS